MRDRGGGKRRKKAICHNLKEFESASLKKQGCVSILTCVNAEEYCGSDVEEEDPRSGRRERQSAIPKRIHGHLRE